MNNKLIKFNFSNKKKLYPKIKKIILTLSNGYDLPFLHYSQIGLGSLTQHIFMLYT